MSSREKPRRHSYDKSAKTRPDVRHMAKLNLLSLFFKGPSERRSFGFVSESLFPFDRIRNLAVVIFHVPLEVPVDFFCPPLPLQLQFSVEI